MQQTTSRLLYDYWNSVRNGRMAPQRFEIEPAKIAGLLPQTFILECGGLLGYRFRLAGTRICEEFGRELRGMEFVDLWNPADRDAIGNILYNVVSESAVGAVIFDGLTRDNRVAQFETLLLPLIHAGKSVNRIMGCICAVDPPYWLGCTPLIRFVPHALDLDWPGLRSNEAPGSEPQLAIFTGQQARFAGNATRRFRVYDGGLAGVKN